ncbi:MAG TPA: hypothetical protein VKP11_06030 [Frankiaceae bacterium]|nr:hypothetical protein [Frankiaceae bacterium]
MAPRADQPAGLLAGHGYATAHLGAPAGHLVVLGALAGLLVFPATRRPVVGWLRAGRVRRAWGRACRSSDLATLNDRVPRIRRVRRVPAGDRLSLRLPAGIDHPRMVKNAEQLAVALHAAEVRLDRDRRDAGRVTATVVQP